MDIYHLLIKLVIAIVCALAANVILPRRVPGKTFGLVVIGLAGIWLGEWAFLLVRREFGLSFAPLYWQLQNVLILPSIIGCVVVLYVVTSLLQWGRDQW